MTCTDTGRPPTPVNEPEPKKRRTAMDEFPEAHEKGTAALRQDCARIAVLLHYHCAVTELPARQNALENYAYSLKNTMSEEKVADKIDASDKETLTAKIDETISWIENNQNSSRRARRSLRALPCPS